MAFTYAEDIVTIDDFSVDDLTAKWAPLRNQGALTDWYISGGQIHCDAGDGHALYRTDLSATDARNRLYLAAGSETDPCAAPLGYPTVGPNNIIQVLNPRWNNNFQFYLYDGGWHDWGSIGLTAGILANINSFEIEKTGNTVQARAYDASNNILQEVSCPTAIGTTYGAGVVVAPGVRATGADVDLEAMRFATLMQVPLPTIARRRGGPRANIVHKTKAGGFRGGGGAPRPTVGILWPRGNRGK